MIGLILLYFIGKAFYQLAEIHNKNKWAYAIAGVVSYYAGTIAGVFLVGLGYMFYNPAFLDNMDSMDETLFVLLGVPFGILCCWLFYRILNSRWAGKPRAINPDILDEDLS